MEAMDRLLAEDERQRRPFLSALPRYRSSSAARSRRTVRPNRLGRLRCRVFNGAEERFSEPVHAIDLLAWAALWSATRRIAERCAALGRSRKRTARSVDPRVSAARCPSPIDSFSQKFFRRRGHQSRCRLLRAGRYGKERTAGHSLSRGACVFAARLGRPRRVCRPVPESR